MLRWNKLERLQFHHIYPILKYLGILMEHQLALHSNIRRLY